MNAMIPPLYAHQEEDAEFMSRTPRVVNTSDPGTGKSRTVLEAFSRMKERDEIDFLLVLAPLSILGPSWAADCRKYTPHLECSIVTAAKKWKQMPPETMADIYITNHDAVTWLLEGWKKDGKRWAICVDEFTVYKHPTSKRSAAIRQLRKHFEVRWILSGTPNPNGITDIWHPVFITDDGERLGKVLSGFRMQVCDPIQGHRGTTWVDKPHAQAVVADRLKDIAIRRKFEECLDVPENVMRTLEVALPPKLMKQYRELQREAALEHDNGTLITAIHAGAKANKLLQLCSGALYDNEGGYQVFDTTRTDLTLELIQQRAHSVVAFNWRHQRDLLIAGAEKLGITYGVIDGTVSAKEREVVVNRYQAGHLQTVFCHPQSAGHGLTFTKGTATIWPSPTSNAEHFQQFNRRIYRAGQTQKTETICIAANGTREVDVYEKLNGKVVRMDDLLDLLLNLQTR